MIDIGKIERNVDALATKTGEEKVQSAKKCYFEISSAEVEAADWNNRVPLETVKKLKALITPVMLIIDSARRRAAKKASA